MENNNEVKRTQGEWVIGYGHTSNCLGIFTKKMIDEGIKDNPICLITPIENMNETDKVNAEFICKAVNEYDKLKEQGAKDKETINSLVVALKDVTFLLGLHGSTIMLEEHEKIYRQAKQLLSTIEKSNV